MARQHLNALVLTMLLVCIGVSAHAKESPWPVPDWCIGDSWKVRMKTWSAPAGTTRRVPEDKRGRQKIKDVKTVAIEVESEEEVGDTPCWVLSYRAEETAVWPHKLYRVWVARKDHSLRRIQLGADGPMDENAVMMLKRMGNVLILEMTPYGFPMSHTPWGGGWPERKGIEVKSFYAKDGVLQQEKECEWGIERALEGNCMRQASWVGAGHRRFSTEETWEEGATWWRELKIHNCFGLWFSAELVDAENDVKRQEGTQEATEK